MPCARPRSFICAKWALFLQLASRVHGVREGLIWAENDTEILQPLQKKGLEDVFRMMEDKYSFKVGLQRALEEAREKKEGLCPRKGKWKQMGCAPFRTELAALKCNCRPYLGILARECVNHTEIYGDFEDKLEYRTARQLYAGKCEFSKQFHEAALALVLVIIVSTALWCVLSGRAANELDEPEEEGQAQQLDAEEGQQREEDEMRQRDEKRRGDLFSDLVRDSKNLHALAMKISALPPPPNSEAFTPIKSNIYRYWALGGKKRSWLHYLGLRFVLVIQLLAPLAILRQGFYRYNWSSTEIHFVNYVYGDLTYGGSHVLGRVLEFAFTYCIGLHCLSIIKKASTENSMLSSLFDELRRQKDARDAGTGSRESYVSRWSQTCLFLDCAMICYVILVGLVDMVLVFTMSEGGWWALFRVCQGLQSGPHRRAVPPPRGVHGAGRGGGILLLVRAADGGRDEAAQVLGAAADQTALGALLCDRDGYLHHFVLGSCVPALRPRWAARAQHWH
ncbi:unnamed protein product [Durusdinium trenchii]|uniref:Uncharacterized protein n=1 Tax=Durusdinium trenchii TaxID=1381693 RepID=A0ABP0Q3M1_9DINO